ncbi:MAG: glycosyltransferase family 2 protein [Bacteroidales bacterium]|jgi:glycosyltransferase involved in cell wall biosynthesis|nr:glycosyltransferase family 2 protein [Bacteroidales bacterium]
MCDNPKYSILIPTRNRLEYLKDCIDSVLCQNYTNYELIVSDNYSDDGTYEYVRSINHPNIKLIKPKEPLFMTNHWEWLLNHARGEWIVFLGSDDGVMPYFFALSDFLVGKAKKRNINVINSIRSYFYWNGCQNVYGNTAINYTATADYTIKNSRIELWNATIIGIKDYLDLPQMYTTSLVHESVIRTVKTKNAGKFYTCINPDANGAAVICSLGEKYIESLIPLSWVGSSPKSTGLLFGSDRKNYYKETLPAFDTKKWNSLAGFISNGNDSRTIHNSKMYFFEALLQTSHLQSYFWKTIYNAKLFKTILFSNVYSEIKNTRSREIVFLKEISMINNISFNVVIGFEKARVLIKNLFSIMKRICNKINSVFLPIKLINRISTRCHNKPVIKLYKTYPLETNPTIMDAYNLIKELDKQSDFIERYISGK